MAAASAEQQQGALWDGVIELTKAAQERGTEPLMWAIQLSSSLNAAGVVLPSPELAKLLVSHVCWSNNVPIAWKFLEKALTMKIVPPILVLALLSASVIPSRRFYPAAYRIYLELLKRHAFSFASQINSPNYKKIMKSIDEVLHISQIFALPSSEPGLLMVGFVFSIVWHLLDASLDDEGLLELTPEKKSRWTTGTQDMEIDSHGSIDEKRIERHEAMLKINTIMAVEIIGELFKNKVTSKILCLARRNLSLHWGCFIQHLRLLAANSSALRNSKNISPEALLRLTSDMRNVLSHECKTSLQKRFHSIIASGSLTSSGQVHGTSCSALWVPFDLFLEDSMDGSQVDATSAVKVLTGLLKSLQAVNQATWQDTFLGLWIAALRVVQRERDPGDGPIPRLDTCMCLLLSVTTLAILNTIEEEETALKDGAQYTSTSQMKEKLVPGKCRRDLVASLQQLGDYEALLAPPLSITSIVNQAAAKAMLFLSGIAVGSGCLDGISLNDMPVNCSGNLRHLIVEACIARNLLDTSAYFWPDYVKGHSSQIPRSISGQMLGWSSLMKGSPLTPPMVNTLVSTPASRYNTTSFSGFGPFSHHNSSGASVIIWNGDNRLCINYLFTATLSFHQEGFPATSGSAGLALRKFMNLAEIEKIYEIAVSGSDDEKISAATILCGASLVRGWNIQEHTALLITRLLSPPVPADCSGSESHLIGFAPFLNVVLVGISLVDCVHIFSLHGMVPQLAGALMPICEVFGSRAPMVSWTLTTGEKISSHAVFSNAFTLLLKLWRFDRPPLEHVMGDVTPVGSQMTPEYLLLVHNNELASYAKIPRDQHKIKRLSKFSSPASTEPIFMDSFPRLKSWYRQNQECIASTLSGLINGSPVHQIVDGLLNMMFRKVNRGGQPTTSGSSNSSGSAMEDNSLQLKLPAWDILEAIPFVLDAALTACAHGRLSPRDLATGLKDLADFLPASLATIISYFSAEVTRGIWKAVPMNGTDWPSPAANLATVEQQIKKILAVTGVDVPSLAAAGGSSPATLPLPLAALVSFTITYKFDKAAESLLYLIGPALITLAAGCPWPCLPIIASLWAQKVKRWSDFLIFNASRSVFHHSSDAVDQLLRICFRSTLGLSSSPISSNGGVGALLGHGFRSHLSGRISPVAPGILYLRVHRSVRNVMFMTEVIVVLLMHSVKDIASCGVQTEKMDQLKKTKHGMRYGQLSLAAAMTRVKAAASLGASLVWITGGINLVQSLIKETLPSWFLSDHKSELDAGESGGAVAMLRGYALAYFAVISGTFAWGVDYSSPASIRRRNILASHLEFLASALDGKISLGCDHSTWRAYVSGFVSLMIGCTPLWMQEMDVGVLKRVSNGLRQWNEDELALALLGISGVGAMGAAAEMIMDSEF